MSQYNFALAHQLVYFLNHSAMNHNGCSLGPHHARSAIPLSLGKLLWILKFCWNAWLLTQPLLFWCYSYSQCKQYPGNCPANDLPIDPLTRVSQELREADSWLTLVARDKQTCYMVSSLPSYHSSVFSWARLALKATASVCIKPFSTLIPDNNQ